MNAEDNGRRRFIGAAAMTMAAARLGLPAVGEAKDREPRELAALARGAEWLNGRRLGVPDLLGKVVVVDFWTYTCINWLRTFPYRRAWAHRYRPGLVLVGVHTPEFAFERDSGNVRRAVRQMRIDYPVVIDNDYAIWRAFKNNYWPALYLIDAQGRLRQHHFGEGEYERSEAGMQRLLAEAGVSGVPSGPAAVDATGFEVAADWKNLRSPETYLGYERAQNLASPGGADPDRRRAYGVPKRMRLNQWALDGEWTVTGAATVLQASRGRLVYRFHARDVHLVMGPSGRGAPVPFRVTIDGMPPGAARGLDVDADGRGMVPDQRLYQLIRQSGPIVERTLELEFLGAGVEAYAFTFG